MAAKREEGDGGAGWGESLHDVAGHGTRVEVEAGGEDEGGGWQLEAIMQHCRGRKTIFESITTNQIL